jgi:phosphatidylserine/phosphatidylglycerophosphate/cardiolipin synthase-like enzyme
MSEIHRMLAERATRLAAELPGPVLETLAAAVEGGQDAALKVAQSLPHLHYRSLAAAFMGAWQQGAAGIPAEAVALALRTAAVSERAHREAQTVELVWTGPETSIHPFRRTEQAILQVLDSARERITLVSFAVYKIGNVRDALVRAAARGVRLTVVVETPDKLDGEAEYSTIRALGDEVTACATVYFWPRHRRRQDDGGKTGSLHVKAAVADARWLILSSANLTEYAFNLNMEMGVLVTGGDHPARVEQHFDGLIRAGMLERVTG